MQGKRGLGLAAALIFALPATALGDDTYVDEDTGSDTNACTEDEPCASIHVGVAAAGPNDTVHVDPGSYNVGIQLEDGISVVADAFTGDTGEPTLNSGGFTAIQVLSTGAGTISGLDLTSTTSAVISVGGPATIRNNEILVPTANGTGISFSALATDPITIESNEFFGDSTTGTTAIGGEGGDLTITDNDIGSAGNGFNTGILLNLTTGAEVTGNRFRALYQYISDAGHAAVVTDATATLTANSVRESGGGTVVPFLISDAPDGIAGGADLHRNELYGFGLGIGVQVLDTEGPVTLDGDLITGFGQGGITAEDIDADSDTDADVSVTGATLWDNGATNIAINNSDLALDSTILDTGVGTTGTVICSIAFTRASTDGTGCNDVQTTADPGFVDPDPLIGDPDLHLTAGSAMLDAGNPAAPGGESLVDIDGDPRELDGDEECPEELVRDIGADEFGDELDCDPPQTKVKGKKRSNKPRVRFRLRSDEAGSTFRCKLDSKPYRNCRARYRTPRLEPGKHKLKVKATDAAGNQDPTAAVKRFRVLDPS